MFQLIKKVFYLLTKRQKFQFIYILSLVFLSVVFELLSLGMIIPILSTFFSGELFLNPQLNKYLNLFGDIDREKFLIYTLISIIIIFILKFLVVSYTIFSQFSFSFKLQEYFKSKIYNSYIKNDYQFFVKNSSSKLLSVILSQTDQLTSFVIIPSMFIIFDGFILIGISIFLFLIEPIGMMVTIIVFIILILVYLNFIKNKLQHLGGNWKNHNQEFTKYLQQSFEGIRDTFLYQLDKFFKIKIDFHLKNITNPMKYFSTLQQLPRLALELLGVILLVCFAASIFIFSNDDSNNAFIKITVFAAAAFKALPSINRLIHSIQSMNFSQKIIDPIFDAINESETKKNITIEKAKSNTSKLNFKNIIHIKDLNFSYNEDVPILKKLNLDIKPFDRIGIVGKTGSGKSTFVDLFSGLIEPDSGDIFLGDESIYLNKKEWQKNISYVSQNPFFFEDTILNNIVLDKLDYDIESVNNIIERVELTSFINSLEKGLDTKIGERGNQISGGQKQRISIARALIRNPSLLILDESTSALDKATQQKVVEKILNKQKITTIFISHNLESLKFCNKIYELNECNFELKK